MIHRDIRTDPVPYCTVERTGLFLYYSYTNNNMKYYYKPIYINRFKTFAFVDNFFFEDGMKYTGVYWIIGSPV